MTAEELDRWSAERVMGWFVSNYTHSQGYEEYYWSDSEGNEISFQDWHPSDPTTGQIWRVVEKMRELGWYFHLEMDETNFALFFKNAPCGKCRQYHGEAIIENSNEICLATLKAAHEALEGK